MAKIINDIYTFIVSAYTGCLIVVSSAYLEEGGDAGGGPDSPVEVHIVRVIPP